MDIFIDLISRLFPFYIFVLMGFVAAKSYTIDDRAIAGLAINVVGPVFVFSYVSTVPLTANVVAIPITTFLMSVFIGISFYKILCRRLSHKDRAIISFSSGTGNNAFFGVPLYITLFPDNPAAVAALAAIGCGVYEATLGFYFLARSHYSIKESCMRLLRLPLIYGMFAGFITSYLTNAQPILPENMANYIRGTYVMLGMMIIGISLANMPHFKFYIGMTARMFSAKFVGWPLMTAVLIYFDMNSFKFFDPTFYHALMILSVTPIAVSSVAFASLLKVDPEKPATAVFISTVFSMLWIPLVFWVLSLSRIGF